MTKEIRIQAPPSKSVSHRAMIASALAANGVSRLTGVLESEDLEATRRCLTAMSARIEGGNGAYVVTGMPLGPRGGKKSPVILDVGESGTTCRLLAGVAAAGYGLFGFRGRGRMNDRPMAEVARALRRHYMYYDFIWLKKQGSTPFIFHSPAGMQGGQIDISLEESSQYLSGLLLGAPLAPSRMIINVVGSKAVSWPYVGLTLRTMEDRGVLFGVEVGGEGAWRDADWETLTDIVPGQTRFIVEPTPYAARDEAVEGDWSNASYFLLAGAVSDAPVTVEGLRLDSAQGDRAILTILESMGAKVSAERGAVTVSSGALRGAELDMGACPDLVPGVAALAAFAEGTTTIRNVAHLRIKESDRIAAPAQELRKIGAKVTELPDGLTIEPGPIPKGQTVRFSTHGDHRLAMSMSLFLLAGVQAEFDKPGVVAKSFPTFWDEWAKLIGQERH